MDGGYYDNYGMTTLMEWLNEAQRDTGPALAQVLVIQIHGAPEPGAPTPAGNGPRGFLFQLAAPLQAMFAVREAAQASHHDTEFQLLLDRWNPDLAPELEPKRIQTVTFTFDPGKDPGPQGGKAKVTPLSWHLTHQQKLNLQREWECQKKGLGSLGCWSFYEVSDQSVIYCDCP